MEGFEAELDVEEGFSATRDKVDVAALDEAFGLAVEKGFNEVGVWGFGVDGGFVEGVFEVGERSEFLLEVVDEEAAEFLDILLDEGGGSVPAEGFDQFFEGGSVTAVVHEGE